MNDAGMVLCGRHQSMMLGREKTATPIWEPGFPFVCASCHLAWGALLVLFFGLFWGLLPAWLVLLPVMLLKEFGMDITIEKDTWKGSATDAFFYLVGGGVGTVLWKIIHG